MKRSWIALSAIFFCSLVVAQQPPEVEWEKTYGGNGREVANDIILTKDNGLAITGWTNSKGAGKRDMWVVKTDAEGNVQWEQTYGKGGKEEAKSIIETSDSNYIVAGWTRSKGEGGRDLFLLKITSGGKIRWENTYGGRKNDGGFEVINSNDGSYVISGRSRSKSPTYDIWVVKTDVKGNKLWEKRYGKNKKKEFGYDIVQTSDNGYAIAGKKTTSMFKKKKEGWIIKTDQNGKIQWEQEYGGNDQDFLRSIIESSDGGYVAAGQFSSKDASDYDYWIVKTEKQGNIEWQNIQAAGRNIDIAHSIIESMDQGYLLAGQTESKGIGGHDHDMWLIKLNDHGEKQWELTHGERGHDKAKALVKTMDGGYAAAGWTTSKGAGRKDMWVVRFKGDPLQGKINRYVQNKISNWQENSQYLKLANYRQNPDSVRKALSRKAVFHLARQNFQEDITQAEVNYDLNSQVFQIELPTLHSFYVEVPLQESEAFHQHFDSLEYNNLAFGYDTAQNRFFLEQAEIHNPVNQKTYQYSVSDEITYKETTIQPPSSTDFTVDVANPPDVQNTKPQKDAPKQTRTEEAKNFDPSINLQEDLPDVSTKQSHADDIAVIIGNSNYQETKNVQFATRDARLMKRYLVEVLGFKEGNILYRENADKSNFELLFGTENDHQGKLYNTIKHGESDVFIYYSGHGAPNKETNTGYFVPTNADPNYIQLQGYSLTTFYKNLSKLPAQNKTVVLDACFSGADLLENVSAVQVKVKEEYRQKEGMAVLTSSSGTQYSTWYNAKEHGLFTWFVLKALHNYKTTDANNDRKVTMKEIHQYISDNNEGVPYYARRLHGKEQTPTLKGGEKEQVVMRY